VNQVKAKSKLLALLLALVMVFGMALPAFAADDAATPSAEPTMTEAPASSAEPEESGPVESADPEESTAVDEDSSADAELKDVIVILHTNDVHGGIEGYAKLAALKAEYEAKGAVVLLMDAGDFSQGETSVSVSEGATAIELMNLVGYDVAAPGNHEFDYGYANLKELEKAADFPILAANIKYEGKTAFGDHIVLTAGEKKIGVFGLDTPETATKAHPAKIKGVTFVGGKDMYTLAQAEVKALQDEGCDYIICLGHLGIDDESAAEGNRSIDLLKEVTGIDVFIDGHSHSTLEQVKAATDGTGKVGDTYLTSTGTKLTNVGCVTLDGETITVENIDISEYEAADEEIATRAKEIRDEIEEEYGATFATSEVDLNGDRDPGNRTEETNLGDLITDAMVWLVTKDGGLEVDDDHVVAITNGGGIRAAIKKGDITKNDVNTVLPFGNTVAVVYVTGEELLEALEASTYCTPTAVGGFPQIAGMNITVDTTKEFDEGDLYPDTTYHAPASIQRVSVDSVNGNEFSLTDTYAVISNDFCAAGGDTYYAFSVATVVDTGVALDVALMEYITEELDGVIGEDYAEPAGRITVVTAAVEPEPTEPEPTEPEPTEPEPVEPQPEGAYTVVRGDSLWKIAKDQYGSGSKWTVIYEANKDVIKDANQIWPGQTLVIPAA